MESVCTEMFPDLMSMASADFPYRWILPVACVALKHHVSTSHLAQTVEISECGRALRVVDEDGIRKKAPAIPDDLDVTLLRASLYDSICAASRTAALEVKVAELECRHRGLLSHHKIETDEACRKRKQASDDYHPAEHVFAYLSECRSEALDALVALRKTGRSAKRYREKLTAANAEINRLKAENEALLKQKQAAETPNPLPVTSVLLPKRVLSLAGFWNLAPNDLLQITPTLVEMVRQRGGTVVRRDGMHVCFSTHERPLLIEAAIQAMAECLPQYKRRLEF